MIRLLKEQMALNTQTKATPEGAAELRLVLVSPSSQGMFKKQINLHKIIHSLKDTPVPGVTSTHYDNQEFAPGANHDNSNHVRNTGSVVDENNHESSKSNRSRRLLLFKMNIPNSDRTNTVPPTPSGVHNIEVNSEHDQDALSEQAIDTAPTTLRHQTTTTNPGLIRRFKRSDFCLTYFFCSFHTESIM